LSFAWNAMMITEEFLEKWLGSGVESELKKLVYKMASEETKERLLKNHGSDVDYGYSFPGVDALKRACLVEVREQFAKTGKKPVVADIGAGFGSMTWKLLAAGAKVDAIEIQKPSAEELSKRIRGIDSRLWQGGELEDILSVMSGNTLEILKGIDFEEKYDFIWISQVIHFLTPEEISQLNKIFKHILKPGGKVFAMANSIHQFDNMDLDHCIQDAFENAKKDDVFCPGFMTINAATLRDGLFNRMLSASVISSYNQTEMSFNGIPIKANAYAKGYLGPTAADTKIESFEKMRDQMNGFPVTIDGFYQVMNLFDPETAKISFSQSGFAVKSFYYDGSTDKKPIPKDKTDNVAVIVLMQKEALKDDYQPTLKRSVSFFKPDVKDKVALVINAVSDTTVRQQLIKAFNKHNFSLLLNVSCVKSIPSLVKILLKHQDELGIKMNEQSSNGNTALDWACEAEADSIGKLSIIEMLKAYDAEHGASDRESKMDSNLAN
jgi:precorrin-6B methylase 2